MGEEVKEESEGAPNGVVPDGSPGENSLAPTGDGKDGKKDRGRKDREREGSYRDRDRDRRRDSRERDRDRERIRDKDRYRDRDRYRDYDRDYDRRRKDRDRRRDRSLSRSPRRRRRRSRSASYSRSRSRDRYRHRRYRDRRSRSHSRGGKRRRSRSRGRSLDRYRRSRDERRGSPTGGVDFDPSKQFRDEEEEKRLAAEKEVAEMERDLRTIFIWQLSQKVRERDVFDLFSKAGKVRDVRLIIDRRSGRHKGAGYVEFYYKEAIPKAMELNGQAIRGFPVAVKPSEAEKNIAAEMAAKDAAAVGAASSATATATADAKELNQADLATVASMAKPTPGAQGFTKLYVGSVHFSVSEDDLRTIFSPYGDIASLQLHRDADTGRSKGFGFIQYSKHESAQKALEQLNGLELAGRALRVGLASTEALRLGTTAAAMSGGPLNPTTGEQPGEGATAGSIPTVLTTADRDGLNELDDGQDRGLALTANQRAQLMQKLSRGEEIAPTTPAAADGSAQGTAITAPGMVATLPGYNPPLTVSRAPSRCLMLRNMFDPQEETEPDFHVQVADDVRDECMEKFGPLKHLIVDKNSAGIVYLKFDQLPHAVAAKASLSGRFFAGKQVIAEFIAEPIYQQRFADVQD
uniref:RRM domain-containing protein n=1 Tax=Rhodosorus marinus TaxID=101924 RepID=A0A7S0BFV5_9RHOD|mmetsp:Transcript_13640/g.19664  ORF Transcript_13640/g.19664 Transcript_13640/m.19664 type:complete len:634 (+) Transcript_13640:189-2090(+)